MGVVNVYIVDWKCYVILSFCYVDVCCRGEPKGMLFSCVVIASVKKSEKERERGRRGGRVWRVCGCLRCVASGLVGWSGAERRGDKLGGRGV